MTAPVRVVVVEDSLVQRTHLVRTLEAEGDISVVGEAVGATEAIAVIERERPDVITLDLEIPDGGGQYVIEQVMASTPTAILVLSATVLSRQSIPAIEALVAGAVDAFPKPRRWTPADEAEVRRMVRSLRGVAVVRHHGGNARRQSPARPEKEAAERLRPGYPEPQRSRSAPGRRVVAIAASAGGPPALAKVLSGLHGLQAPVLVVQHLHSEFVGGLVEWMCRASELPVLLAQADEPLEAGTIYIGPGGVHLRMGPNDRIVLSSEPVTLHRPSANELFGSVAEHAGARGIGVVLTGMGDDGAAGLLTLRKAGGMTIAQDEASCAVFGMPRAAERAGAAIEVLPLDQIAAAIVRVEQGARR
jgi:two-component system chemotaxis response regulator CheB